MSSMHEEIKIKSLPRNDMSVKELLILMYAKSFGCNVHFWASDTFTSLCSVFNSLNCAGTNIETYTYFVKSIVSTLW